MRHERKEWYTCDRCGDLIQSMPSDKGFRSFRHRIMCKPLELDIITSDRSAYVTDKIKLIAPEIASVEIIVSYTEKMGRKHLCGKCRKDFERFMKNENDR